MRDRTPERCREPWYADLAGLASKGSAVDPVGGFAGLAAARAEHQGQFFTPLSLVAFMWQVTGLFAHAAASTSSARQVSILDSAGFGSGRMFAFADPRRHRLVGIEIDGQLAEQVRGAVAEAGFDRDLEIGSFDEFRVKNGAFTVGLLNPPFSLTIDTPWVEPYTCNAYGKHGPKSSALSHVYCIRQALGWCRHVAAIVPRSFGDAVLGGDPSWAWARERLVAVYTIPRSVFIEEGANVETVVCVFGPPDMDEREPIVETVRDLSDAGGFPALFDLTREPWNSGSGRLTHVRDDSSEPSITLPHTGDRTVRVVHDGRKIGLRFACGLTQGLVLNRVYADKASAWHRDGFRSAEGIRWKGQGWFDMENYLAQPDPDAALAEFLKVIRRSGGEPVVDPAIPRLLARKARRAEIEQEPFRHVAYVVDGGVSRWVDSQDEITGTCRQSFVVGAFHYRKTVEVGEVVTFTRDGRFGRKDRYGRRGPKWRATICNYMESYSQDWILAHFDIDAEAVDDGWNVVHEGLATVFPADVEATRKRALAQGLDRWCSWGYQFDDLVEIATKRRAIVAWEMGLGKARLALALCMIGGGKHNLVTVEAHLLDEMRREIAVLEVPKGDWQVITKPEHARSLRRINLVAYSRLKAKVATGERKTIADILRRRIHTHVCDEGHLLRNDATLQTRAVIKVSAKVRYLMSGTPIANYPRDMLPLIQWVAGDGRAVQEFGRRWPYMRPENLRDVSTAPRGIDVFRDMFVTTAWVTNEFADNLRSGAKREIPEIADVTSFRAFVAPWVKRRVLEEPDVAKHVRIPKATRTTKTVKWDRKHLGFYVKVAREFVEWFRAIPEYQRKGANMVAVLAKMQAVQRAANFPAFGVPGQEKFRAATSKQRHAVKRLRQWTTEGHKSILLCESPDTVDWFAGELAKHEIESVKFHGRITIASRIKALDKGFRFGGAPVLLATKHCLQTGYNIHQASRVLVYDRTWTPKTEHQACARVLRPQQTREVLIEFVHLPGSIDEYQAQMVEAKSAAMRAGLDYGGDGKVADDFMHIETILGRFVDDFEQRYGVTADDLIAEVSA